MSAAAARRPPQPRSIEAMTSRVGVPQARAQATASTDSNAGPGALGQRRHAACVATASTA
jgi:hypothetical protein